MYKTRLYKKFEIRLIVGVAFRSKGVNDGLMLANGVLVTRETAHEAGMGNVYDRILIELVRKMTDLRMDKTELGFLRFDNTSLPHLFFF